jgi:hypothetical protein
MNEIDSDLVKAFPRSVKNDALSLATRLSKPQFSSHTFSVLVSGEAIEIPYRTFYDPAAFPKGILTVVQTGLFGCLLTRHHNGFIREEHLKNILRSDEDWIPAYVIQLVGEYIVEIVQLIRDNLEQLPQDVYRNFLLQNLPFWQTTKQRVISYWDCYYRGYKRAEYPGFHVVDVFDGLIARSSS